jgi:hypothetical protein
VGRPLERWVQSDGTIEWIIRLTALQREAERRLERNVSRVLHLWYVPALGDVRRLSEQVAQLDRRVRELGVALGDEEPAARAAPPAPARRSRRAAQPRA